MNRTKGMNQMSDRQRAARAADGDPYPTSTFRRRKPAKPTTERPVDTGPDQVTVDLVLARDNWSCVVCGDGLHGRRGREWSIHHRLRRSQGLDNRPSNLVSVCGHGTAGCHSDIHGGPTKAREAGWLLKSTDVPETFRMAHSQHGWLLLNNDGTWTRTTPDPDPMEASLGASEEF